MLHVRIAESPNSFPVFSAMLAWFLNGTNKFGSMDMTLAFGFIDGDHEDFDVSRQPTSGYEYLKRVQWEAMQCPDVMVADVDRSTFSGKQTTAANVKPSCLPAPEGFAPSLEWQEEQVADFADVRQGLVRHRLKMSRDDRKPTDLPKRGDEIGWCVFCLGTQMALQLQEKRVPSRSIPEKHASEDLELMLIEGSPPLLSIVALVSQTTILQLLQYHISWLRDIGFSHRQGQWFYALLACLEKPLPPDTSALLRALARQCAALRAPLESPESELLSPLNLIIALVSRYFGQSDLADHG